MSYAAKDENKFIVFPLISVYKLVSNISTLDRDIVELLIESPLTRKKYENGELSIKSTTSEKDQIENSAYYEKENSCELHETGTNDEFDLV